MTERMPRAASGLRDEPVEAEVVDSELVYEGRVWDVRSDTIRYGDEQIVRQYVDHPGAAAVIAIDEQDRVLLIQQYRHPIRHRDWEVPAGLLDVAGEPPIETAARELAEEADLVAASIEPLVSIFTTPGGNDEIVHLFLARDLSAAPDTHAREQEEADIRLEWVPLADAVAGVLEGRLRNGILAVGVLAAAQRLAGGAAVEPERLAGS
ncbi:NUDIX domain-containing protein [Microbacterium hominis]|nr:NUDIX hydrolase [Microbacterium hominis]